MLRAREREHRRPEHSKIEAPERRRVEALERRRAEAEVAVEGQRLRPQLEPKT